MDLGVALRITAGVIGQQAVDRLDDGVFTDAEHLLLEGKAGHAAILTAGVFL